MHTIRRRFALFISLLVASLLIASPTTTRAQSETDYYAAAGPGGDEYPDYGDDPYSQQDNLYADYAAHQQEKLTGGGGGMGMGKFLLGCSASWFFGGKFHSARTYKKLKSKHQKEQKQLYSQYYNDVYKLSEQNQELQYYIEQLTEAMQKTEAKHEMEAIQRDYDEFKQPDIDGDDRISRAEFNMYVKNYLSNYPGLSENDYPKFEDFDHDKDGFVSFSEYAQQMALQAQKAERDQLYNDSGGSSGGNKKGSQKGVEELYKQMGGMYS